MSALNVLDAVAETREVYVLDAVARGPEFFPTAAALAAAVVAGDGFVRVTASFEATVRVLTDGTTPAVDLTDLCTEAYRDCLKERLVVDGFGAKAAVQRTHSKALATEIERRRFEAGAVIRNAPASEKCTCDGASFYSTEENKSRHPFLVNASCPFHGSPDATTVTVTR